MINMSFWNIVKNKWIRDNDPTVEATEDLIKKSSKTHEEIDKLNQQLNGFNSFDDSASSVDDINKMFEGLNDLGISIDIPDFDISEGVEE